MEDSIQWFCSVLANNWSHRRLHSYVNTACWARVPASHGMSHCCLFMLSFSSYLQRKKPLAVFPALFHKLSPPPPSKQAQQPSCFPVGASGASSYLFSKYYGSDLAIAQSLVSLGLLLRSEVAFSFHSFLSHLLDAYWWYVIWTDFQ